MFSGGRRAPKNFCYSFFCFLLTKTKGGEEGRDWGCDGGGVGWFFRSKEVAKGGFGGGV